MSDLFEMLLYEATGLNLDVPVLVSINGAATICGDIDSSQECIPFSPPRYTRLLNATLVDGRQVEGEASFRVPRPPESSAIVLSGGPNRRWLVAVGASVITGEEVSWDQWLDYNSCTNGGGWNPDLVTALKQRYPLCSDERDFFHLINVRFHNNQTPAKLGGPIYVPTSDVSCFGNRWDQT
ncbi:MAG: hypothetical protein R3A46_03970 [Thermomicrobiales bacterium]